MSYSGAIFLFSCALLIFVRHILHKDKKRLLADLDRLKRLNKGASMNDEKSYVDENGVLHINLVRHEVVPQEMIHVTLTLEGTDSMGVDVSGSYASNFLTRDKDGTLELRTACCRCYPDADVATEKNLTEHIEHLKDLLKEAEGALDEIRSKV